MAIGINFRATAAYVADGANETYHLAASTYPTTRAGVTFGWVSAPVDSARDRNSAIDRRLAGVAQATNNGSQGEWRLDLSAAGTYPVDVAQGDANSGQAYQYLQILDTSTVLLTRDDTNGTTGGTFNDSTGANYSSANWPGSHTTTDLTFSTTQLRLKLGSPAAQSGSSTIAHLYVGDASGGGGGSTQPPRTMHQFQLRRAA